MKVKIPLNYQPKLIKELKQNESGVEIKMHFSTPVIIPIRPGDTWNDQEITKILDVSQNDEGLWCLECEVECGSRYQ